MAGLTVAKIRALKAPERNYRLVSDAACPTLYVRVHCSGNKRFYQRLRIHGRKADLPLGSCADITLAEARELAAANRKLARRGEDPRRKKASLPTFKEAATVLHQSLLPTWKNAKHAAQWISSMEAYVFPKIGTYRVDTIGKDDALRCITPIWEGKHETARRVRSRIKATMAWAISNDFHAGPNPAGEVFNGALPKFKRKVVHQKAMPWQEVPRALASADDTNAGAAVKLLLKFGVLTATRPGEARLARWDEITLDGATWVIPAERMKGGRQHRVPLSTDAMALLEEARALGGGDYIFPSPQKPRQPLSNMAVGKLLKAAGYKDSEGKPTFVQHGFRSSFRDWCGEQGVDRQLAEAALAHTVGGTEGAYFRSDLFERRRELMQQWADHCTQPPEPVVTELRHSA